MLMKSKIVFYIPINFSNRREMVMALEEQYGSEYVLIGRIFQSTTTDNSCEIDICDRQTWAVYNNEFNLRADFELSGQDKLDGANLEKIEHCQQVVCLTSTETGYEACLKIAQLVQVIVMVGGIAIKVESAGIAHHRDKWLANYNSDDVFEIYSLFVMLLEGDNYYYSCGMHNFGKADVAINLSEDPGLAVYVMNVFNYYRLTESPILQDGHTFQPDIECPRYHIRWIVDREYTTDSHQHNPYGRWYLAVNN